MRSGWLGSRQRTIATAIAIAAALFLASALAVSGLAAPGQTQTRAWKGNLGSLPPPAMVAWLVDGNNLSCSKTVPADRETILRELAKIASPRGGCVSTTGMDCVWDDRDSGSKPVPATTPITTSSTPVVVVVVVFDGNEDELSERTEESSDRWLRWTVTEGIGRKKDRADDWIVEKAVPYLVDLVADQPRLQQQQGCSDGEGRRQRRTTARVNLVSADKDLQKRVKATEILRGGSVVHPPKFWKDYLPVLQEKQRELRNDDDDDELRGTP